MDVEVRTARHKIAVISFRDGLLPRRGDLIEAQDMWFEVEGIVWYERFREPGQRPVIRVTEVSPDNV
jgi:hypothetical protein